VIERGFDRVRTTLESALKVPFAAVVSSTLPHDGKTEVAVGTARAFARAGFRTLIADANPLNPAVGPALGLGELALPARLALSELAPVPAPSDKGLDAVSIAGIRLLDEAAPALVRMFVDDVRSAYDVVIFDACEVFFSGFVPVCAAACDGVVLAVRYARNPDPEDDRVVSTLEQMGARIIGSVPTGFPDDPRFG